MSTRIQPANVALRAAITTDRRHRPLRGARPTYPCLDRHSLGATLDSISESLFLAKNVPASQRTAAARWIAGRQGLPGSYAGMFAPTAKDALGFRLFTGETVRSRVGIAHLLGEEGCRILSVLQVKDPPVQAALGRAIQGMATRLEDAERRGCDTGIYCCGTCSVGYWRNLALNLFPRAGERLREGLKGLRRLRRGDGTWRRFPFYYTCLTLTEIEGDLAKAEMQYAATRWRRILPRLSSVESSIARRRAAVGRRLLKLCET